MVSFLAEFFEMFNDIVLLKLFDYEISNELVIQASGSIALKGSLQSDDF